MILSERYDAPWAHDDTGGFGLLETEQGFDIDSLYRRVHARYEQDGRSTWDDICADACQGVFGACEAMMGRTADDVREAFDAAEAFDAGGRNVLGKLIDAWTSGAELSEAIGSIEWREAYYRAFSRCGRERFARLISDVRGECERQMSDGAKEEGA